MQDDCLASLDGCGKSPLVRLLLAQRGIRGGEEAERFLNPKLRELGDPFALPDMEQAVARLLQAVDSQEPVVLFGDYDVDGVTSITLLHTLLAAAGCPPRCFLPLRMEEGYGLSRDGLQRCLAEGPVSLLIAVDCGTTARDETAWLKSQGIDVIILDHHEPDPARLPDVVALVNPKCAPGPDWHYLCSAGVVFKVAHAFLKKRPIPGFDLKSELDLVALATVADIMPLVGENRLLVRQGLQRLGTTRRTGLRALIEVAGVTEPYTSMDLGFRLGPRLNAAGRLDTAHAALDLLLCEDAPEAAGIARDLDLQNRERQSLEQQIQAEAVAQALGWMTAAVPPQCLVVASRGWHPGVVGIVAARLMRQFHLPVFVIAVDDDGQGKGSGRSVPGVSLVAALDACRPLLTSGGGHDMAAGVGLRWENLDAFRDAFAEHVRVQTGGVSPAPILHLDAEVRLDDLTLDFLDDYDQLQPFGSGNPQPLFLVRGVFPSAEPRLLRERHWRLELMQNGTTRTAMWFNAGDKKIPPPPWDIAFHVDRNTFRGNTTIQLLIQALRPG
ncbi:MAG: recj: single-stranded-dna-specific exonuclease recj [Verrucomicrobiales bacterium]|nr:recj: single-stranded-dna-specific exonuclease recj [Verrucomicrobiales bacterium]